MHWLSKSVHWYRLSVNPRINLIRYAKKPKRDKSHARPDHPHCHSATWICMCGHSHFETFCQLYGNTFLSIRDTFKGWSWLTELRFYIPLDTKQVISEMLFPANLLASTTTPHHNCFFTALFPGPPPGWAGARRELLDFMAQGKINRGRHTDNLAGLHSIRTNHCPPPPSP